MAIELSAGTLQHALRTEPIGFSGAFLNPIGDSDHVLSLLAIFPPKVWQPESGKNTYRVGGMRDLTHDLVSRLLPEVMVPCLEFSYCPALVQLPTLRMLAARFVSETQFEEWLADPDNWRNWFRDAAPNGVTFGKLFGVGRKQGHKRLCDAQARALAKSSPSRVKPECQPTEADGECESMQVGAGVDSLRGANSEDVT